MKNGWPTAIQNNQDVVVICRGLIAAVIMRGTKATVLMVFFGIAIILAILAYSYDINLDRAPEYAVAIGLIVLSLIVVKEIVVRIWKRRKVWLRTTNVTTMTGLEFERYVVAWLKKRGFTGVRLTEHYDLGVDIIAGKDGITWGVQVKRCNGMVRAAAVRQVVTALRHYNCNRAIVVTNGVYSRPAIELARSNDCMLVDRIR